MPTWLLWTLAIGVPLVAAAVPVIIHLINLTRYRKVDWAAMEFLLAAYKRTRKRMQMENLIMLLLRVAAVMLLALAFFPMGCQKMADWAGDALGFGRGGFSTDAPMHLVIVLDNSASMACAQEGETSFERGRKHALSLVDSLDPDQDRISLVLLSDVYVPPQAGGAQLSEEEAEKSRRRRIGQLSNLDLKTARKEIAAASVAAVDTNMLAALREASRLVQGTAADRAPALVVISDFARSGWAQLMKDGSAHVDFSELMLGLDKLFVDAGTPPTFFDAGPDRVSNVAVVGLRCEDRVVGDGMGTSIYVDIANFGHGGDKTNASVNLSYSVDGGAEKRFGGAVSIPPGGVERNIELVMDPSELALKPPEKTTGASRTIEITVIEPDSLERDNKRIIVVHVVPDIPILLVNGAPSRDDRLDEVVYLAVALGISDSRNDGERSGDVVRVTPNRVVAMNSDKLAEVDSFLDYRLVVLANVDSISKGVAAKLEEFVRAGFGMVIFDGDRVQHKSYNETLYRNGEGLLPAELGSVEGSSSTDAVLYGMLDEDPDHPAVRLFSASPEDRAFLVDQKLIRAWRELTLPDAKASGGRPSHVVLSVAGDAGKRPLMVEREFGRGKVVYVGTTASERWNEMWSAGSGLPLFLYHELVSYLTEAEVRYSNLSVGEPWRRILRETEIAPKYTVRDPAGTVIDLAPLAPDGEDSGETALRLLDYGGTALPGVYSLTASATENGKSVTRWKERFAVNMAASESDLAKVATEDEDTEALLRSSLEGMESEILFVRTGAENERGSLLGESEGPGLWMWLALAAGVFLLLESGWSAVITKPEE